MQQAGHVLAGKVLARCLYLDYAVSATFQNSSSIDVQGMHFGCSQVSCVQKESAADLDRNLPAAAALLDTEVAVLPFCALSDMPLTMRTIAMLYSRRRTSSDIELVS